MNATVQLSPEALEQIARRAAEILREELPAEATSPWMTTNEAAAYIRASRQRVFDLTSQGRLPVHKDGARNLYRREDLDAHLEGRAGRHWPDDGRGTPSSDLVGRAS